MGASLGTGNRGVSALGASLVKLLSEAHPGAKISMLLGHRFDTPFELTINGVRQQVPVLNFRQSPRAGFQKNLFVWILLAALYRLLPLPFFRNWLRNRHHMIRAIAEAQMVGDIRGGDSFSDIYGLKNFLMGSLPALAVIWIRGEVTLLPQTYGPYKSAIARMVAKYILSRASKIISRDRASLPTLEELLPSAQIQISPDVAFALESRPPASPKIEPPLPVDCKCLIGLNVNGLVFNGGYTRSNMFGLKMDYRKYLLEVIPMLLADEKHRLLLVPHTFAPPHSVESDPEASRRIMAELPAHLRDRIHLVTDPYDQNEIKGLIGQCHFFIGSRMHACIAALSQGIPSVAVAYSRKFVGVFHSVSMEDWVIDAAQVETAAAVLRTIKLFEKRTHAVTGLKAAVSAAQDQLECLFATLVATTEDAKPATTTCCSPVRSQSNQLAGKST